MPVHLASRVSSGDRRRIGVTIPLSEHSYLKTAPSRTRAFITPGPESGFRRLVSSFIVPFFLAFSDGSGEATFSSSTTCKFPPVPLPLPFIVVEPLASASKRDVEEFVVAHKGYRERIGRRSVIIFKGMEITGLRDASSSRLFREDVEAVANSVSIGEAKILVTLLRIINAAIHTIYNAPLALASGDSLMEIWTSPDDDLDDIEEGEGSKDIRMDTEQPTSANHKSAVPTISSKHSMENLPIFDDQPLSGHFFTFDESLECSDLITVPSFVSQHLQRFLGESSLDRAAAVEQIRQAWGPISRTYIGYQLSHLVKCLEFTITASAVLHPIIRSGQYFGAVLGTSTALVSDSYDTHHSQSAEEIQEQIERVDVVSFSRRKIVAILLRARRRANLPEGEDEEAHSWSSVRSLSRIVLALPLTTEEKAELVTLAAGLTKTLDYFLPSPDFIIKAVVLLQDPGHPVDASFPMYPEALFPTSRLEEVLSVFGASVPCFDIPSAPTISLSRGTPAPKSNFVARPLPFRDALLNWSGWIDSRVLHNGPAARSEALRERAFEGADRTRVWAELVRLVPDASEPTGSSVRRASKKVKQAVSIFDLM